MINPEELAICRRRGHYPGIDGRGGWEQCQWCGTWLREVVTREEREDDPPEEEMSAHTRFDRARRRERDQKK